MIIDPDTNLYSSIKRLSDMSSLSLEKLFAIAVRREILKGDSILEQDDFCKSIFFVEQGYFRIFIVNDDHEINTGFIFENKFTTNLKSLRTATPSETTIRAMETSIVYEFKSDDLAELYNECQEIASLGRKIIEQQLIDQEEHANLFKIFSPLERYQYLLSHKPQIIQKVSITHISSYLGIARETLSRIRKIK